MKAKYFLVLCVILTPACSQSWSWKLVTQDNKQLKLKEISLQLPKDWVIFNKHFNKYHAVVNGKREEKVADQVIITKNGLGLDAIRIISFDSGSAFPSVNKGATDSTIPSELAELFIAEKRTVYGGNKIDVINSKPMTVANEQGFIVQYKMTTPTGIEFTHSAVGIVTPNHFYAFEYRASLVHFYEAGLPSFLQMLDSVKLTT